MEQSGKLHTWNDEKGFGFIQPDNGGEQLFVHISAVRGAYRPKQGSKVFFIAETDHNGRPRAKHMRSTELEVDRSSIRHKPRRAHKHDTSVHKADSPSNRRRSSAPRIKGLSYKLTAFIILLALPLTGLYSLYLSGINLLLPVYPLTSALVFIMFWSDKNRAQKGQWRTPEKTLHTIELLGGWPGTLIAQQIFRHKTRKASYLSVLWLIIALHQLVWLDKLLLNGNLFWNLLIPLLA